MFVVYFLIVFVSVSHFILAFPFPEVLSCLSSPSKLLSDEVIFLRLHQNNPLNLCRIFLLILVSLPSSSSFSLLPPLCFLSSFLNYVFIS